VKNSFSFSDLISIDIYYYDKGIGLKWKERIGIDSI